MILRLTKAIDSIAHHGAAFIADPQTVIDDINSLTRPVAVSRGGPISDTEPGALRYRFTEDFDGLLPRGHLDASLFT